MQLSLPRVIYRITKPSTSICDLYDLKENVLPLSENLRSTHTLNPTNCGKHKLYKSSWKNQSISAVLQLCLLITATRYRLYRHSVLFWQYVQEDRDCIFNTGNSVALTPCLRDQRFGSAVNAGESISVRGVGSLPFAIASSVVREEMWVGKGKGYNHACAVRFCLVNFNI